MEILVNNDTISGFKGINPKPVATITWQKVLDHIRSDKYKASINSVRNIISKHGVKSEEYKKAKCNLPGITFGGTFSHRANAKIIQPTGFIIPDMDNIPQQVRNLFNLLIQDTNIWFIFRSPSNEGLKVGVRAENISNDEDHKLFYTAVEEYFKELYGIEIDTACKDISRLTFVSHDPELWINPQPQFFNIKQWTDIIPSPPEPVYCPINGNGGKGQEKYARKVLESCCRKLLECPKGNKHITRLKQSRLIGGYLQWLDEGEVLSMFEQAIIASGTPNVAQAMKTVKNGIEYGRVLPIELEDLNRYDDERKISVSDDILNDTNDIEQKRMTVMTAHDKDMTVEDKRMTVEPKRMTVMTVEKTVGNQNLADDIHAFLRTAKGSFTVESLDRELNLTTRSHRQQRSYILLKYINNKYKNKNNNIILKKDPVKNNVYHIIPTEVDWIDLSLPTEESFPIKLPFDLDKKISIPPKSIIIVAGTTNSAKTALILNTLRLNINSQFEKLFLVSEGAGEIKGRIKSFGDPVDFWKDNIMIASQSDNFDTVIENYNTDGLTCIDYLEPTEGQYYMLTSQIRDIYDCLKTGVAMIALQKKSNQTMGRGGEGTAEKARLYMTVDYLCACQRGVVCAVALTKVKQSIDETMQGKELHFRLEHGSKITPLTDWMFSSRVNRDKCIRDYENDDLAKSYKKAEEDDCIFRAKNGNGAFRKVRITRKQAEEWAENMPYIDVFTRLEQIAADSMQRDFLHDRYIFQIPAILSKENETASCGMGESG